MTMQKVPCLVCDKPYDGTTHCSVIACRACAMFFKRCETVDIPLCKTGSNNCKLNATIRSSKSKSPEKNQTELVESHQCKFAMDLLMLVPETMPILKRYCYHYALSSNTKKNYEMTLLREGGAELMKLPGNRKMGYMTQSRSISLRQYETSNLSILHGSFPAFSKWDIQKQDVLVHMIKFLLLDLYTSYRTWKVFSDVNTNRFVVSETMLADFNNLSSYIDDNGTLDPMDLKTISDFLSTNWRYLLSESLNLLRRIQITDVEYLATCCLLVWDEGLVYHKMLSCQASDFVDRKFFPYHFPFLLRTTKYGDNFNHIPHLAETAETHRTLIYKDLDYYYRNILHLDNYVERILNIKELIRTFRNNLELMTGSVHFLRMFNYFNGNEELMVATEKVFNIITKEKKV